jgi:hypothetical protein
MVGRVVIEYGSGVTVIGTESVDSPSVRFVFATTISAPGELLLKRVARVDVAAIVHARMPLITKLTIVQCDPAVLGELIAARPEWLALKRVAVHGMNVRFRDVIWPLASVASRPLESVELHDSVVLAMDAARPFMEERIGCRAFTLSGGGGSLDAMLEAVDALGAETLTVKNLQFGLGVVSAFSRMPTITRVHFALGVVSEDGDALGTWPSENGALRLNVGRDMKSLTPLLLGRRIDVLSLSGDGVALDEAGRDLLRRFAGEQAQFPSCRIRTLILDHAMLSDADLALIVDATRPEQLSLAGTGSSQVPGAPRIPAR